MPATNASETIEDGLNTGCGEITTDESTTSNNNTTSVDSNVTDNNATSEADAVLLGGTAQNTTDANQIQPFDSRQTKLRYTPLPRPTDAASTVGWFP